MEDESWLRDYLRYFNEHLKIPTCLKECELRREICCFKEGRSMIDRVWNLKAFMKEQDLFVNVFTTNAPGIMVYEDGHQIAARPNR